jgi:cytochrome c5
MKPRLIFVGLTLMLLPSLRCVTASGANAPTPTPTPAPAPAASLPVSGKQAYLQGCASCHVAGLDGAPKIGDHAAWGLRIAQGRAMLYRHTINGKGTMPPRGGTQWPDATIRAAVDYMVSLNK